ncbi:MAG: PKD domain-containing protein [Bacteroidales bacterium]
MKKLYSFLIISIFSSFAIFSQDWLSYRTYTTGSNALIDNVINDITHDSDSNIWIATRGGLQKISDDEWETYTSWNSPLEGNHINCLFSDMTGILWIGTEWGSITRLNQNTGEWKTFHPSDGFNAGCARSITQDSNGNTWVASEDGIWSYNGASWTRYSDADGLLMNDTRAILADHDNNIWFSYNGGDHGLTCFDGSTWTTYTMADGLNQNNIVSLYESPDSTIWAGTDWGGGICWFKNDVWTAHDGDNGLNGSVVFDIIMDADWNYRFATENGVNIFDGTTYSFIDLNAVGSGGHTNAILHSLSGEFWYGHTTGITIYDGSYNRITTMDGLICNQIYDFAKGLNDTILVATDNGLSKYHDGSWKSGYQEIPSDPVFSIEVDTGVTWYGGFGLTRVTPDSIIKYDNSNGLIDDGIQDLLTDNNNHLWIATEGGVSVFDGINFTNYDNSVMAGSASIGLEMDNDGNVWVCHGWENTGVSVFDGTSWTFYTTSDGLVSDDVRQILKDSEGSLWFATSGGVSHFNPGTGEWTTYQGGEYLPDNDVLNIFIDSENNYWFLTNNGIGFYNGANWKKYPGGSDLPQGPVHCAIQKPDGNLWFGTNEGIFEKKFISADFNASSRMARKGTSIQFNDMSTGNVNTWNWDFGDGNHSSQQNPSNTYISPGKYMVSLQVSNGADEDTVIKADYITINQPSPVIKTGAYDGIRTTNTGSNELISSNVRAVIECSDSSIWLGTTHGISRIKDDNWTSFDEFNSQLGNDRVTCLYQDASERIWIGKEWDGITMIDGSEWHQYFDYNSGLSANDIRGFAEDLAGNIYIATANGISKIDVNGQFEVITTDNGLLSNEVHVVYLDDSDSLWVGYGWAEGGIGLSCFNGTSWKHYTMDNGLPGNQVLAIYQAQDGTYYFGTEQGLGHYDGSAWTIFTQNNGLINNEIKKINPGLNNQLILSTPAGLSIFDGTGFTNYSKHQGLAADDISDCIQASTGEYYIASSNGLSILNNKTVINYTTNDGLLCNSINDFTTTSDGKLWISTENGLSKYDGNIWQGYTIHDGIAPSDHVRKVYEDSHGNVWIGGHTLNRHDGLNNLYSTDNGLAENNIHDIVEDHAGNVYISHDAPVGLSVYTAGNFSIISSSDGLIDDNVREMAVDQNGVLWVTTPSGIGKYDGAAWTSFTEANGLPGNDAGAIFIDDNNRKWIGTHGNISCLTDTNLNIYNEQNGIPPTWITTIYQDNQGTIWAGTDWNGILKFDGERWINYTSESGLLSNNVSTIHEGPDGNLWIGSDNGISIKTFDNSIMAFYPFNGDASDTTSNGNHGTIHGPVLVEDRFGNTNTAYQFDGTDDYIDFGKNIKMTGANDQLTLCAWINPGQLNPGQNTILAERDGGNNYQFAIMDQALYFSYWSAGHETMITSPSVNLVPGNWYFAAVTYDGTMVKLYLNGEMVHEEPASGAIDQHAASLYAGTYLPADAPFNGSIDDVAIFNRALSPGEIFELALEGNYIFTEVKPVFNISHKEDEIIIDGVINETTWNNLNAYDINRHVGGNIDDEYDLSGTYKITWDEDNLYILIEAYDETMFSDPELNPWESDNIELFFDWNNAKTPYFEDDDYQMRIVWDLPELNCMPGNTNYAFTSNPTNDGYICEMAIPWNDFELFGAGEGMEFGFDVQLTDNDGTGRDAIFTWNAPDQENWCNTSGYANMRLTMDGNSLLDPLVVPKFNDFYISDGYDAIWMGTYTASTSDTVKTYFEFTNVSIQEATGLSLAVNGTDYWSPGFTPTTLAPGDSTFVVVHFVPKETGVQSGTLEITWDGGFSHSFNLATDVLPELPDLPVMIQKVKGDITIDGMSSDTAWQDVTQHPVENLVWGTSNSVEDINGKFRATWSESHLYLLIEVLDDNVFSDQYTDPWFNDNIELFFDWNNSKGDEYDHDDHQLRFVWDQPEMMAGPEEIEYSMMENSTGYTYEAAIPWEVFGLHGAGTGMEFGFDIQIADNDSTEREAIITWYSLTGDNWQNASGFGTLALSENEFRPDTAVLVVKKDGYYMPDNSVFSDFGPFLHYSNDTAITHFEITNFGNTQIDGGNIEMNGEGYFLIDHGFDSLETGQPAWFEVGFVANKPAGLYQGDLNISANGMVPVNATFYTEVLLPMQTCYVSESGCDENGDGTSSNPFRSIQRAIDRVFDGDTIFVSPGTYYENINYNGKNIVIASEFIKTGDHSFIEQTIVDGMNEHSVVSFENGETSDAQLIGFTITHGNPHGEWPYNSGGGIFVLDANPYLANLHIKNNHSNHTGGGITLYGSSARIENVILKENYAVYGGGISISGSTPVISGALIADNTAEKGGAISLYNAQSEIINITAIHNQASQDGGGIKLHNASANLQNSIIHGNIPEQVCFEEYGDTCTLNISYTNIQDGEGGIVTNVNGIVEWLTGNQDADPMLNADYKLISGSPSIDAGTPDTAGLIIPEQDIFGNPRIYNSIIDQGAHEFLALPDLEIISMESPVNGCNLPDSTAIEITVTNVGNNPALNPVFSFRVNDGDIVSQEGETDIYPGDTVNISLTHHKMHTGTPGVYDISIWHEVIEDIIPMNDTLHKLIYSQPTILDYPYLMESDISETWYAGGENSTWNIYDNGSKIFWTTSPGIDYGNSAFAYVVTPCFELSSLKKPVLEFEYLCTIEDLDDGVVLQYSTDGGDTWLLAGYNYETNIYNHNTNDPASALVQRGIYHYWTGNENTEPETVTLPLQLSDIENPVQFRFLFINDDDHNVGEFAFDNFSISEGAVDHDLSVTSILTDWYLCQPSSTENVTVYIVNEGLETVSNFTTGYILDGTSIPLETVNTPIAPGDTLEYTFNASANLYTTDYLRQYNFELFASATDEQNPGNDTLKFHARLFGHSSDPAGWNSYNTCNGMAGNENWDMVQDNAGNIWSCSFQGVSKFDGNNWTIYTEEDGLAFRYAWKMLKDSNGDIWFGTTQNGITRFDGTDFEIFPIDSGIYEACIYEDDQGNIWFGSYSGSGVAMFDGTNWQTFKTENTNLGQRVNSIGQDEAGNMLFANDRGVSKFDGTTWSEYLVNGESGTYVNQIFNDSHGNIWFTNQSGYHLFDGTTWTTLNIPDLSHGYCNDIIEDNAGNVLFASQENRVFRYDGTNVEEIPVDEFYSGSYYGIYSLLNDYDGNLWIGSYSGGLFMQECLVEAPSVTTIDVSVHGGDDGAITVEMPDEEDYTFLWDNGATSQNLNNLTAGNYILQIINMNNCYRYDTIVIEEPAEITCDVTADFTVNDADSMNVQFIYGDTFTGKSFEWDFGDGTTGSGPEPEHQYNWPGIYPVYLTVFDSATSCTADNMIEIEVGTVACDADFGYTLDEIDSTTVMFKGNTSEFVNTWYWEFGDDNTSDLQNPVHEYIPEGTYTVCLTSGDTINNCYSTTCKDIQVGHLPDKYDLKVNRLLTDRQLCRPSNSENITIEIVNVGTDTVAGFTAGYILNGKSIPNETVNVSLAPADTFVYTFEAKANLFTTKYGKWNYFKLYASAIHEQYHKNDTLNWQLRVFGDFVDVPGWKSYNTCNGLAGNEVWDIVQDNSNHIWTCSFYGVSRFDGTNWTNYTEEDGLAFRYAWKMLKASNGDIWFGTSKNGITRYNGSEFEIFRVDSGLYQECIYEDNEGKIWFGSYNGDGVAMFDGTNWYTYKQEESNLGQTVLSITQDTDGNMLFANEWGVSSFNGNTWSEFPVNGETGTRVSQMFNDSQGRLWIVNYNGYHLFDGTTWFVFTHPEIENPYCTDIIEDASGNVVFSDHTGIFRYTGTGLEKIPINDTYKDAYYGIYSLLMDNRGNLWIGTYPGGLLVKPCVIDPPTFVVNNVTFAGGHDGSISVTVPGTGDYTYLWNNGATSADLKNLTAGSYMLHITNENNCYRKDTVIITEPATSSCNLGANFTATEGTALDVQFNYTGDSTARSFSWSFGDGTTAAGPAPVRLYDWPGVYDVNLSVFDSTTRCMAEKTIELIVGNVECNAKFEHYINNDDSSLVHLTDFSEGYINAWYWEFGDGNTSTLQNPEHKYSRAGKFNVCLTTYDTINECISSRCREIQVGSLSIDASFSNLYNPENNSVLFMDNSRGEITNWFWTFGDGNMGTGNEIQHTYSKPGSYNVCLNVFNESTGKSNKTCKTIKAGEEPCNLKADFSRFVNDASKTVKFTDKSTGEAHVWFWNFGNGKTSAVRNPEHVYSKPGYYMVSLAVRDTVKDCSHSRADFIKIGEVECKASFDYTADMDNLRASFTDVSTGGDLLYWNFGDGNYSGEIDPVHVYSNPGLYKVGLTVSNADGNCMDYIEEEIQVGTIECSADFDYYVDSAKNIAYFTGKTMGESTRYFWRFGDGSVSTKPNPVHKFAAAGFYTVSLNTINDVNGCMDSYSSVVLIGSQGIDCEAEFIYQSVDSTRTIKFFDKSVGDELTYLWNFGDGYTSTDVNPSHQYGVGGYYNVCLTVYNSSGIQNSTCKNVQVALDETRNCLAEFIFVTDSLTREVVFTDKSLGEPDSWTWNFDDNNTSVEQNPIHAYADTGIYTVHMQITNTSSNCESDFYDLVNIGTVFSGMKAGFGYDQDTSQLKTGGYPVEFNGVSLGDAAKIVWNFGDGSKDSTTMSPTHVYDSPGAYTVCLTISDPVTGQSATSCKEIVIESKTGIDKQGMGPMGLTLGTSPNPFSHSTLVNYHLPQTGRLTIQVFDMNGKVVETLYSGNAREGDYQTTWTPVHLKPGMYYIRMITNQQTLTHAIIIAK